MKIDLPINEAVITLWKSEIGTSSISGAVLAISNYIVWFVEWQTIVGV